jgi:hypothetical protein
VAFILKKLSVKAGTSDSEQQRRTSGCPHLSQATFQSEQTRFWPENARLSVLRGRSGLTDSVMVKGRLWHSDAEVWKLELIASFYETHVS